MQMGIKHMQSTSIIQLEFNSMHITIRADVQQVTFNDFAKFEFWVHKDCIAIKSSIQIGMPSFKNL